MEVSAGSEQLCHTAKRALPWVPRSAFAREGHPSAPFTAAHLMGACKLSRDRKAQSLSCWGEATSCLLAWPRAPLPLSSPVQTLSRQSLPPHRHPTLLHLPHLTQRQDFSQLRSKTWPCWKMETIRKRASRTTLLFFFSFSSQHRHNSPFFVCTSPLSLKVQDGFAGGKHLAALL